MTKPPAMLLGCCVSMLVLTASAAGAQSFDCAKASTAVEKLICADPEIAKLDTEMTAQYKRLLSKQAASAAGVTAVQRRWLATTRNKAATPAAVKQVYRERLDELAAALDCITSDGANWTQAQMNECEAIAFENSDAELGEVYQRLQAAPDKDPVAEAVAALNASQAAWLKFRDAQCEWETFDSRGGSIHPMLVSDCARALTDARIRQLKATRQP